MLLVSLEIHAKQAARTLSKHTVGLCHHGMASRFPAAVPEAGCPRRRGLGQEAASTPQRDSAGTARMVMLSPAQGLGLAISRVALAEAVQSPLGQSENGEGAGRRAAFLLCLTFE